MVVRVDKQMLLQGYFTHGVQPQLTVFFLLWVYLRNLPLAEWVTFPHNDLSILLVVRIKHSLYVFSLLVYQVHHFAFCSLRRNKVSQVVNSAQNFPPWHPLVQIGNIEVVGFVRKFQRMSFGGREVSKLVFKALGQCWCFYIFSSVGLNLLWRVLWANFLSLQQIRALSQFTRIWYFLSWRVQVATKRMTAWLAPFFIGPFDSFLGDELIHEMKMIDFVTPVLLFFDAVAGEKLLKGCWGFADQTRKQFGCYF